MREAAISADLYSPSLLFLHNRIPGTIIKLIHWAITKQTVNMLPFMTWIISAFMIFKILIRIYVII